MVLAQVGANLSIPAPFFLDVATAGFLGLHKARDLIL